MNTLEWFNRLTQSPELINLLPMQVQPGLPLPAENNGKVLLYVPFYHMWVEGDIIFVSPTLYEAYFDLKTLRLVSYNDLQLFSPEKNSLTLCSGQLSPETIDRKAMNMEYVFELLDEMRSIYQRRNSIAPERIKEYRETMKWNLPVENMREMYIF